MKAFLVTADYGPEETVDEDDYGDGRGFRWTVRPPSEPNCHEEDLPKNDQAASAAPQPAQVTTGAEEPFRMQNNHRSIRETEEGPG